MRDKVQFWLYEGLKGQAEIEAKRNGVSLTAWLTMLITKGLREARREENKEKAV